MKTIIIFGALIMSQTAWSQTKVSVTDGDWNNPTTWNPVGIPLGNEDSIIVNHEVDLFGTVSVSVNHLIVGSNGIIDGDDKLALGGSLKIDGEVAVDTVLIGGGDYFINNGLLEANYFVTTNLMNENNGDMDVLSTFSVVEPFLNSQTGVIEALDLITTSDGDLENNGVIYLDSWINEGNVLGSGSFCIEECFKNFGSVNGSLDICDVTPTSLPGCDFNAGTFAPTVTFCAAGPCSGPAGISDQSISIDLSVSPNPSTDGRFNIESDTEIIKIEVIDLMGRVLFKKSNGDMKSIDISSLRNGDYILVLETENSTSSKRIVKLN